MNFMQWYKKNIPTKSRHPGTNLYLCCVTQSWTLDVHNTFPYHHLMVTASFDIFQLLPWWKYSGWPLLVSAPVPINYDKREEAIYQITAVIYRRIVQHADNIFLIHHIEQNNITAHVEGTTYFIHVTSIMNITHAMPSISTYIN